MICSMCDQRFSADGFYSVAHECIRAAKLAELKRLAAELGLDISAAVLIKEVPEGDTYLDEWRFYGSWAP